MKRNHLSPAILMAILCISGTVWAVCPSVDLSGDCFVDLDDYLLLASQWLMAYDYDSLTGFTEQWLTEGIPDEPEGMTWVYVSDLWCFRP